MDPLGAPANALNAQNLDRYPADALAFFRGFFPSVLVLGSFS